MPPPGQAGAPPGGAPHEFGSIPPTGVPPTGTPPPRKGGAGRVIAVLVALAAVAGFVWAGIWALGTVTGGTAGQQLATETSTGDVRIENPCGPILVRPGEAGVVTTWAVVRFGWREPTVSSTRDGDRVVVDVDCPTFSLGSGVSLEVAVPPGGRVEARSSAGSVKAERVDSDLVLHSSAGSVSASDVTSATVAADSSAGSVSVTFAAGADPTTVQAASSAGSVTVRVPDVPGVAYRVQAESSAGSVDVDVRTDPASDRSIIATSSAGSVRVGYR
jgi:hypothetical protein